MVPVQITRPLAVRRPVAEALGEAAPGAVLSGTGKRPDRKSQGRAGEPHGVHDLDIATIKHLLKELVTIVPNAVSAGKISSERHMKTSLISHGRPGSQARSGFTIAVWPFLTDATDSVKWCFI